MTEDGDGGFGGDALDIAMNVAVEHDVTDDEDPELTEASFEQVQNGVKFRQHA
jgi:hypothetical protein